MILDKATQRYYRSILFKHQDGVVITGIVNTLLTKGVISFLEKERQTTLDDLCLQYPFFHKGYLNVALRSLASQGIISYHIESTSIEIAVTNKFESFKKYANLYTEYSKLYSIQLQVLKDVISESVKVDNEVLKLAQQFSILNKEYQDAYFQNEVKWHLEAIMLLPYLVKLGFNASYLYLSNESVLEASPSLKLLLKELELIEEGKLNQRGQFLIDKCYAYGVTVSYWPIFTHINSYLYGDFNPFFIKDDNGIEQHVLRSINVWGSGGAHATYFKKFDEVILDIFNQPLEKQPRGIIDVGCGNGALLEHVFDLIWNKTKRRKDLENNKLILVGADFNKEALLSTKRNLEKANIWADVVWGDIGNPNQLDKELQEKHQVSLSELLNVRSFLDHNRPFNFPKQERVFTATATGAFAYRGEYLKNTQVEESLIEHFEKWKPYIQKHGLLMIELHTVSPDKVSVNLGRTPCTAYDVTHGFSDQYIVDTTAFYNSVSMAGLSISKNHQYVFPNKETPTISINLIK
ncbi:AprA-related methyltransferase [Pseudofulvibacter geojedonensis]|uniref:Class I SAM-dependent methyltransferase n=1 Tax=Pseudofulvibacter geojedonensis TaxID=1123758 RepID=A0ABW3I0W8_9FLAO